LNVFIGSFIDGGDCRSLDWRKPAKITNHISIKVQDVPQVLQLRSGPAEALLC